MSIVFDTVRSVFDQDDTLRVAYPWDAWRSNSYFMFVDEGLASVLETLSDAAQTAFVLATAEWICARHFREPRSGEVLAYIDAVWAASLTAASVVYQEFPLREWQGPILEPLCLAQQIAAEQHFEGSHDGATVVRASWARNLALQVIGEAERAVFDRWTEASLETLKRHHPYQAPRWNSIFDAKFSNVDKCPPDALSVPDRYDPAKLDSYIAKQTARAATSLYLGAAVEAS